MKWMILAAPLAIMGCVEQELDVSAQEGARLFQANCAACHGTDAKGAGVVGVQLFNLPPDLTVLSANNGGVFPRNYVLGAIDGFDRGDHFSAAMPEFGAGDMGPSVIVEWEEGLGTPVPARLLALAAWLEQVQE